MAILQATFEGIKFEQVEGFRISAAFTPRLGFQGNFFVYLLDSVDADKQFPSALKVVKGPKDKEEAVRGTLKITDNAEINYEFPDIDLSYAESGATRAARYRLLEFRYNQDKTDRGTGVDIKVENSGSKKLTYGRLKEDYDFNVGDAVEPLLGFRARVEANNVTILRFSALRSKDNSMVKKIIETQKSQISQKMESFSINFKQAKVDVTAENLVRAYIVESFGAFTQHKLPSLTETAQNSRGAAASDRLARLNPDDFSAEELITHENSASSMQSFPTSDIVETGTFVFSSGAYSTIELK